MPASKTYSLILWAADFAETMAVTYATELRHAGLCVKVVGLSHRQAVGAYGVTLVPDLTLEQALPLAEDTICLIVPTTSVSTQKFRRDPRIADLFCRAHRNKAKFITGQMTLSDTASFPTQIDQTIIQPDNEDLIATARSLVTLP